MHDPRPQHQLPAPTRITLGARGTTTVWDSAPGRSNSEPPVLLLHGWNVDAPTNFASVVSSLAAKHRVIMYDHHGHGDGGRPDAVFSLEAAAGDAVAVLDSLDIPSATIVGYSMGGAIAQLVARSTPDRCRELVLVATAANFSELRNERRLFRSMAVGAGALRRLPEGAKQEAFLKISALACRGYPTWVLETVRRADPLALLEAGVEIGRFDSSTWSASLPQPAAMIVTTRDTVVPPHRQVQLARELDVVQLYSLDADHDIPIRNDPRFTAALDSTISAVRART